MQLLQNQVRNKNNSFEELHLTSHYLYKLHRLCDGKKIKREAVTVRGAPSTTIHVE